MSAWFRRNWIGIAALLAVLGVTAVGVILLLLLLMTTDHSTWVAMYSNPVGVINASMNYLISFSFVASIVGLVFCILPMIFVLGTLGTIAFLTVISYIALEERIAQIPVHRQVVFVFVEKRKDLNN
jgi:hypothetical protein